MRWLWKWLILGAAAALLFVAGCVIVLCLPRPECPVHSASAARVIPGMTRAEVEAILGGPPGDYRVRSRAVTIDVALAPVPGRVLEKWRGDAGIALVQFGPDGRVAV